MRSVFFKAKLNKLLVLICALIILGIFCVDIKSDYYFYASKKQTSAVVKEFKKVEEYNPFIITISYYNDYLKKDQDCVLELDGHYGGKINENLPNEIQIFYTKQSSCDVYIIDYKHPTTGSLVIHLTILIIVFVGSVIFTIQLFSKEK